MTGKERAAITTLAVLVMAAAVYSWNSLVADGILTWGMKQRAYWEMAGEITAVFALFVLAFRFSPTTMVRIAAIGVIGTVFLWAHQAFAAVAVSGLYAAYLWIMGRWLLGKLCGRGTAGAAREFLVGCMFVVCMFCLLSALGAGRILYLWIFVAVSAAAAAADAIGGWPEGRREGKDAGQSLGQACLWAAVLTFFCIQAGRMNIAVDFDSLWYGVRSPYILDNGRGIYENMGTIGIVYTYSKGFEVLTLPLSALPSYSFAIGFNLWLLAGILWIFGRIIRICAGAHASDFGICFLASLPGIMNMGITAKSDVATLFFQVLLLYEMILYLKGDRQALWYGLGAFFFSWTMKPTALVFSTAVMGMSGVFFAVTKRISGEETRKKKTESSAGPAAALMLSLLALGGIWTRTFLITGLPVTSVFSSVLTRIGFQLKYPFCVQKIPNSSAGITAAQWLKDMAKRIWGILFNPQGPDMDHVILAWGSLAVWFFLCVCTIWLFLHKRERAREEKRLDGYLHTVFWPFSVCCVISLLMLTQVDGNYFMLFYVLLMIYGFRLVSRLSNKKAARAVFWTGIPVILFSGIIMTLTNWSWTTGFTPVSWRHMGYYDHQKEQQRMMEEMGNKEIWEILEKDSRHRLIAIGDHPQVLAFPCNAQSYLDITGTWGNVALVKYMDNFVEFMRYGKTDYVYAQAGYIGEDERSWSLTCDLIEYGVLIPVCFEKGNMLAKVDTEGVRTEESVKHLEEFLEKYVRKG